jgi:cyclic pyranopterin phosphate synthase
VRKGALTLLKKIGALEGLKELVFTTNGSQLLQMVDQLRDANAKRPEY